jgi:two-component system, OmpR family, phosphate regulon sensor histidine kinase PhoR
MNISLRWKITIAFTLLVASAFGLLHLRLQTLVKRNSVEVMQQTLLAEARLAQLALPSLPWRPVPSLAQKAKRLDSLADARVTLIDPNGKVLADSRENAGTMENHSDRPERLQALRDGIGSAVRHSATQAIDNVYVAIASPAGGAGRGSVLRLSRPLTQVRAASQHLLQTMLLAFVLAAALVWMAALLVSHSLTRPIETLVRVARRVERGDLQARVEGIEGAELGELAAVFNSATSSLSEAVERSRRDSRRWETILEQMSGAVVIVDSNRRIEFTNSAFARFFGVVAEEVKGRSEDVALNYELSALLQRAMAQNAAQHGEVRVLYPETRTLSVVMTPLHGETGEVTGAVGLLRDVSDRHQLDEMRREFVANASHELRTPAAAVKALAEALQMGALKDPEKGPRFVQQIVEAADRQATILDDMMTLTRVEMGRQLLQVAPLSAAQAFEEAARQLQPTAAVREVALQVEVDKRDLLMADAAGLHTVLLNLLDNALKYTPPGGAVTLRGQAVPNGYEIRVADTGIGIPVEHQSRIFERFYRVDKARDRATGGTGLGLSIVKHVIEAHGGRVSVRSTPGQGSKFTVFLPSAPATV